MNTIQKSPGNTMRLLMLVIFMLITALTLILFMTKQAASRQGQPPTEHTQRLSGHTANPSSSGLQAR